MKTPLGSYANRLSRVSQSYANEVLKKYKLKSSLFPYLITLDLHEGINQNEISQQLRIDKAMSARAIKKLIELGYLTKEPSQDDPRAFVLILTDTGRALVPLIRAELDKWNKAIVKGLSKEEQNQLTELLGRVLDNATECRNALNGGSKETRSVPAVKAAKTAKAAHTGKTSRTRKSNRGK